GSAKHSTSRGARPSPLTSRAGTPRTRSRSSSSRAVKRAATHRRPARWQPHWKRMTHGLRRPGSAILAPDVNVLVYAHRTESPDHPRYADWVRQLARGPEPFGFSDLVASGFVRIATNQRLWRPATEPSQALAFVDRLRRRRSCRLLAPGS